MSQAQQALEAATKQINKLVESKVAAVTDRALPFDEYQFICGQIRGLRLANDEISSLLRTLKEQEDE
jgi:hypothetical protein